MPAVDPPSERGEMNRRMVASSGKGGSLESPSSDWKAQLLAGGRGGVA